MHSGGFVTLPNSAVNDDRLSFRARGLLAYMLGRPVGWRFSADRIAVASTDGRRAVLAGLTELRDCGYIRTARHRISGGRFATVTEVAATPELMPPTTGVLEPHFGEHAQPECGLPTSVDSTSMSIQRNQTTKDSCPTTVGQAIEPVLLDDAFDAFWAAYPLHVGKRAAVRAFAKVCTTTSVEAIVAGARRYAADPNREDGFTAHASSWLNAGRWTDDPLPSRARTSGRVADGDALLRRWHAEAVAEQQTPQLRLAP